MHNRSLIYTTGYNIFGSRDLGLCTLVSLSSRVFKITQNWQCWHYCQLHIIICLQFPSLLAPHAFSQCKIRDQQLQEDHISRLRTSLDQLIPNDIAKTKLAIMAFSYCREFVKNSSAISYSATVTRLYLSTPRILIYDTENKSRRENWNHNFEHDKLTIWIWFHMSNIISRMVDWLDWWHYAFVTLTYISRMPVRCYFGINKTKWL